jgi:hypothetical protein
MCQTNSIVHILITGEATEHGLTKQPSQQVPRILASATIGKNASGQIGQANGIVEFAIHKQPSVRGDAAAMEFQLQAPVKLDPQRAIIRFTRRVFDLSTSA